MNDSDKIMVVFYVDVSNVKRIDIPRYMTEVKYAFDFDESIRAIYIPVNETSKVEVLNPRYISKSEYKKTLKHFNETLDIIKKNLREIR